MPRTEIILFGVPQIQYNGVEIEFTRRKAVALIAYLALTNQPHSRDALAEFLWPNNDPVRSRASLRRTLSTIGETPFARWIDADRNTILLKQDADLWIDVQIFSTLIARPIMPDSLVQAAELYREHFMAGFTLRDSAAFDHWQSIQNQNLQHKLFFALEQLSTFYRQKEQPYKAAAVLRQWLHFDPLAEVVQHQLIELYEHVGQRGAALAQYETFAVTLKSELGLEPPLETRQLYERIKSDTPLISSSFATVRSSLPPLPTLVIGREQAIHDIKLALHVDDDGSGASRVVLQGWPGIGKTTLSSIIAHDGDIHRHYRDGVLWASLGQYPNLLATLIAWGQSLSFYELERAQTIEEASARLTAFLKDRRVLIVIDDVWAVEHAQPLKVGGQHSGLLVTTRLNEVARAITDRLAEIYKIPILSLEQSLTLLQTLAPEVVAQYPGESADLANDLEGLPLALQVAGRLLRAEMEFGWGIGDLLMELRESKRLLEAQAPADRMELVNETTPTIAALLQRSIERLSAEMQERFALLGVFAPKPATFSLPALAAVWETEEVRPSVRLFVNRGLLEPASTGHFQMHALLVMLAKSLVEDLT